MASVGTAYIDVAYNVGAISRGLSTATGAAAAQAGAAAIRSFDVAFGQIGAKAVQTGKAMSASLTLPIVGLGALAVREFTGYERSLTNIEALVGATREQTQEYAKDIKRVGVEFGIGAQAAGEALYFITSSGFAAEEAVSVLESSAMAAASGLGDVQDVADLVTSAITSYGKANLTAAQATDILTVAIREGKGDPAEYAGAMARVLPIASQLGVSFDQVAGAFASMSKGGSDANEVATQIRQIMASLINPTKEGEEALLRVGTSFAEIRNEIADRGLLPALVSLKEKLGEDTEAMNAVFGDVRAITGVFTILGQNLEDTQRIFGETADSAGAMSTAFDIAKESGAFKLDQALAELTTTLVDLGAVLLPIVNKVASGLATLGTAFANQPEWAKTTVVAIAGIVAAIGPLLFIGGKLIKMFLALRAAVTFFSGPSISKGIASIGTTSETAAKGTGNLTTSMSGLGKATAAAGIAVTGLVIAYQMWNAEREKSAAASASANESILGALTDNDIAQTERSLAQLRTEVAAIDEELANSSELAWWDEDRRADLMRFRNDLTTTGNAMALQIAIAKEMAAATGGNVDEIGRWLAKQQQAGTTYETTADALKDYTAAVESGEVAIDNAAAAQDTANAAYDDARKKVKDLQGVYLSAIDGASGYQDALDAIAAAQRSADQATRRVADAQRGYRDALRSVEDAQDDYAESLEGIADAQQEVVDAQRRLDDALAGPSEDDQLSLEGARIRLEEARRKMAEGGFEDDLEARRAALDLRQAELDLARLEEQVAGRPAEAARDLADAQANLADAQADSEAAAQAVRDANDQVADAAYAVRDAQYEQTQATYAVRDAQDQAARAALDLHDRQADLAAVMRDEEGASSDLLDELLGLQGAYPNLAAALQPYIDQLRILIALRDRARNPNIGQPFPEGSGMVGPQGSTPVPQNPNLGAPFPTESGFVGPQGARSGITVYGYHRAPEDIVNEIENRQYQALNTLGGT